MLGLTRRAQKSLRGVKGNNFLQDEKKWSLRDAHPNDFFVPHSEGKKNEASLGHVFFPLSAGWDNIAFFEGLVFLRSATLPRLTWVSDFFLCSFLLLARTFLKKCTVFFIF